MKSLVFIVLLLLPDAIFPQSLENTVNQIETEWAHIHYGLPKEKQAAAYPQLLEKAQDLANQFPGNADALYWVALIKANYAEYQDSISALDTINEVRELLDKVIAINPKTMAGSAYVVLGVLHYMMPGWPIAFGNDEAADKMLKMALDINPEGIDSNYFYGDYLLSKGLYGEAEAYFNKAIAAPVRTSQAYGDGELKKEALAALEKARQHKTSGSKNLFLTLFGS